MPERIQLRRTKGWRKPPGAIVVARPSKWGNPWTVAEVRAVAPGLDEDFTREMCVGAYRIWLDASGWAASPELEPRRSVILDHLEELRGRDLACWCPLDQPCHADVLLDLANRSPR